MKKWEVKKTVQSAKSLPHKCELSPCAQVKKLGIVVGVYNPSGGDTETGGPWSLLVSHLAKSASSRFSVSEIQWRAVYEDTSDRNLNTHTHGHGHTNTNSRGQHGQSRNGQVKVILG